MNIGYRSGRFLIGEKGNILEYKVPFCSISAISMTASTKIVLFLVLVKENEEKMLKVGREIMKKNPHSPVTVLLIFARATQYNVTAIILQVTDFQKHCLSPELLELNEKSVMLPQSSGTVWKVLKNNEKLIIYKCQYLAAISPDEKAARGSLFSMLISLNPFLGFQILIIWSQICFLLLFTPNLSSTYACMIIPLCSECPYFRTPSFLLFNLKTSRTSSRPTSMKPFLSINLIFK